MTGSTARDAIRIGIVGCGLIGRKRVAHLPSGASVVACHDVDPGRAHELAASCTERASIRVTATAEELFDAADVDLVIIATTHDALAPLACGAVAAGKHVLLEKPGADRLEALLELRDAAATAGVTVRVGYNHRFHPALLKAREIVADGSYGPLLHLRARYGHGGRVGYEREWRADRARSGGGELIDQGSHLIDLVRAMFGDVDLAFAECDTAFWDMPVEDNAFLALRVRSGGFAWLHASWTEWKNLFSFEVTLARAKLEVAGLGGSYGCERLTRFEMRPEMGPPGVRSWEFADPDPSWRAELTDVIDAIEGRPALGASLDDAIATMTIINGAYAANRVRVEP